MAEPFDVLKQLQERVKKAEATIPDLRKQLQDASVSYAQAMDRNEQLSTKLKKYEELAVIVKDVFGLTAPHNDPSVSSGASGSRDLEVKDPSRIIEVSDPQEPLRVNTTELRGQIAKLILDGNLSKGLLSAKSVRSQLIQDFGKSAESWDVDTITRELKELGAPPYRLFIYTSNRMFRLRAGSEKRVKE